MKRPHSKEKVLILQRNAERRAECTQHGKQKMRNLRAFHGVSNQASQRRKKSKKMSLEYLKRHHRITLPEHLDINSNPHEIIVAARKLRTMPRYYLDISPVKSVTVSTALMLAAEIHARNLSNTNKIQAHDTTWDRKVRKQLIEMGFLALLQTNLELPQSQNTSEQKAFIQFTSGTTLDGINVTDAIANVEKSGKMRKLAGEIRLPLYAAISEAITNTYHHAYDKKKGSPGNRWWISASVSKKTKEINMACYDRGQTIPVTIRKSKDKMEHLDLLVQKAQIFIQNTVKNQDEIEDLDGKILLATMQRKESSTRESFRGKGLKNLRDLIIRNGQGTLTIYSGKGVVQYTKIHGEKAVYSSRSLPEKMLGTLVECSISPRLEP